MSRVLLLLSPGANRRLLAGLLAPKHEILQAATASQLDAAFDLGIVDSVIGLQYREWIESQKDQSSPVFLPFLFIKSPKDQWLGQQNLWSFVDEVITAPVEKLELQVRIETLLRTRQFSLDLKHHLDELQKNFEEQAEMQRILSEKVIAMEKLNQHKNQLVGTAAHDLRTPLAVIAAYSDFLREDAAQVLSAEQAEFIEKIKSSGQFMLSLVDDLLDLAKIEAGKLNLKLEPIDLPTAIAKNAALNQTLAVQKGIQLQVDCPDEMPPMLVDGHKLEQVLNNLIGNAIKFSPADTTIKINAGFQAPQVLIQVEDEGPGIPSGQMDTLFEPFAQSDRGAASGEKSAGLGLAIVQKIVEGHGGRVWVESEVGKGSKFCVEFPYQPPGANKVDPNMDSMQISLIQSGVWDREAALQHFGGDRQALQQGIEEFGAGARHHLAAIMEAVAQKNSRALAHTAYLLAWELSSLGAFGAFEAALELEKLGKSGNLDSAEKLYVLLENEVENFLSTSAAR